MKYAGARAQAQKNRGEGDKLGERLAAELEEEREKRALHVQQIAARRIGQMGLARGWSAWHEQWLEVVKQRQMMAATAARLTRPKLTACLTHWRHDWEEAVRQVAEEKKRLLMSEHDQLRAALEAELKQARSELGVLQATGDTCSKTA